MRGRGGWQDCSIVVGTPSPLSIFHFNNAQCCKYSPPTVNQCHNQILISLPLKASAAMLSLAGAKNQAVTMSES